MKNTIQNLDELNFEKKISRIGYGNFPYLLYKSSPATFTQIPIHLNKPNDLENYRTSETFIGIWSTIKPWFAEKAVAWSVDAYFDGFEL